MYAVKKTIAGDFIKVQNYTGNTERAKKSHQQKRAKKKNPTREEVKRYNKRMRAEKLQMAIIMNFTEGYFVTLRYSEGSHPNDYQTADTNLTKFLRCIKRECQRKAQVFRYIAITERGHEHGHLHHHVLVENMETANMMRRSWSNGEVNHKKIYGADNAYMELSEYMLKDATKEERIKGSSYHISRNLRQPTTKREIHTGTLDEEPTPDTGYEVLRESIRNGIYEPLGIKYQSYIQKRKIEPLERKKRGMDIRRNVALYQNTLSHDLKIKLEKTKRKAQRGINALLESIKGA